jgi:hypothetical protein
MDGEMKKELEKTDTRSQYMLCPLVGGPIVISLLTDLATVSVMTVHVQLRHWWMPLRDESTIGITGMPPTGSIELEMCM